MIRARSEEERGESRRGVCKVDRTEVKGGAMGEETQGEGAEEGGGGGGEGGGLYGGLKGGLAPPPPPPPLPPPQSLVY